MEGDQGVVEPFIGHSPYEHIDDVRAFLEEVHAIDVAVYSPEDAGEVQPMVDRYEVNPQTYVYVRDSKTGELAGYINFFPVKKQLKKLILDENTTYADLDDAIPPEQIAKFKKDKDHFLFILSIAIAPKYQGSDAVKVLTAEFVEFLRKKHAEEQCRIDAITACVVSPDGAKFLTRLRFHIHHQVKDSEEEGHAKFIYICDNEDSDQKTHAGSLSKLIYIGPDVKKKIGKERENLESFQATKDEDGNLVPGDRYVKSWKDDVFLYLPMTEHAGNHATDPFFAKPEGKKRYPAIDPDQRYGYKDDDVHVTVLDTLKDSIHYECSSQAIRDMEVHYVGAYDFLHTIDAYPCRENSYDPIHENLSIDENGEPRSCREIEEDIRKRVFSYTGEDYIPGGDIEQYKFEEDNKEIIVGLQKGYVFITSHRPTHMYVVNVYFEDYQFSTTQLEDQVSNNYLKIVDPRAHVNPYRYPEKIRFIRLYDYLWEKFSLFRCGQEKIMLCMSNKPDPKLYATEFENVLAAEVYNSTYQEFHIHSPELIEKCSCDKAQYDYYEVYLSDRVIAFVLKDYPETHERISITATYSFIAELIMFQNTALARMNIKVSDSLYQNENVTMEFVKELEQEYGRSIPFWEPGSFSYIGTAKEAGCIKEAFSNQELLETYNKHQEYLEHMADLMASEQEGNNSTILNVVMFIFAIAQVQDVLIGIMERFYASTGIEIAESFGGFEHTIGNTFIGVLVFIWIYLVTVKNAKKRDRRRRGVERERETDLWK